MDPVLVTRTDAVERLVAAGGGGAEVSVATGTAAIGVLVSGDQQELACWLATRWGRHWPGGTIRFVRCDLDTAGVRALTWYRSARRAEYADLGAGLPTVLVADRWRRDERDERSVYFSLAAVPPNRLAMVAARFGMAAALPSAVTDGVLEIVERSRSVGRPQYLAFVAGGRRPRVKLSYAVAAGRRAAGVLGEPGLVLWERYRRMRVPPGYVGYTVDERAAGMRIYARPLLGRHLPGAIAEVAWATP